MTADGGWSALLDRLEADIDAGGTAPWRPEPTPAPLPPELADRARRILARQQRRLATLRADLAATRAHLDALALIPAERTDAAAYIDREG